MIAQIEIQKLRAIHGTVREVAKYLPFENSVIITRHVLMAANNKIAREFSAAVKEKFEKDSMELFGSICPEVEEQEALKQLERFAKRGS